MKIYIVRHGESVANTDWTENTRNADHSINLTDRGHEQARAAGQFLSEHFAKTMRLDIHNKIRLWHSPYNRTRQTAQNIYDNCKIPDSFMERQTHQYHGWNSNWFQDKREHLLLAEQQFGLFDGLSDEDRNRLYPDMVAHYEKCKRADGKMWPKMPMGESRFEVCQRVHQSFGTFHRDCDKHGIDTIVVVGHGTTNRAFMTMWLHKPYEWMHKEPNPKNCSIRFLKGGDDKGYTDEGYIFEGFE